MPINLKKSRKEPDGVETRRAMKTENKRTPNSKLKASMLSGQWAAHEVRVRRGGLEDDGVPRESDLRGIVAVANADIAK